MKTPTIGKKTKFKLFIAGMTSASCSTATICWWLIQTGTISPATLGRSFLADGLVFSTWSIAILSSVTSTNLIAQIGVGVCTSFFLAAEDKKHEAHGNATTPTLT